MKQTQIYVAFLRGINVGGHHKMPMADLRKEIGKLGFENVQTLLNTGNIIFEGESSGEKKLEDKIANHLEDVFGFPVPVLIRKKKEILELVEADPFGDVEVTKDIRLYVAFLKKPPENHIGLPWESEDESFRIIDIRGRDVCSVLDLAVTKTPKGMDALGKLFEGTITTRNWNTIIRISDKLDAQTT